jgi:hypothetical protein
MVNFFEFKELRGGTIWINPNEVAYIRSDPDNEDVTEIHLGGGDKVTVAENTLATVKKLAAG